MNSYTTKEENCQVLCQCLLQLGSSGPAFYHCYHQPSSCRLVCRSLSLPITKKKRLISFLAVQASSIVVNCPTRQSLLLFIGSLHWLSSWRWWPSMWGGKIVSATLEARNGRFDPFFLQISQITYLQMENFVFAILYLVYFALKYMYFEDLSRISENGGYL